MNKSELILKWSFFGGMLYFLGVAVAHLSGIKIPFLFIYFNIPSTVYQDRIISVLSIGWTFFFFSAYSNLEQIKILLKSILGAGAAALLGIAFINSMTDFKELSPTATPYLYWIQWIVLLSYFGLLLILYYFSIHTEQKPDDGIQLSDRKPRAPKD